MAERCARLTRREATGEQGAIQPPAKVPLQRRKDKDQNHLLLNLDLSLEFMRNVSSTFIPQRHRWKRRKKLADFPAVYLSWNTADKSKS